MTVVGGINNPDLAERIISEGKADFVSLARQMYADPEFANKAEDGRANEIRGCLRCFCCMSGPPRNTGQVAPVKTSSPLARQYPEGYLWGRLHPTGSVCAINPESTNASQIKNLPEPEGSRNVLVIGGGPGGMQAAITACDRGHRVTLVEKNGLLGGVIKFTDNDLHKTDLKNYKNLLIREVNRRDIQLMLNTEVTTGLITKLAPEVLILAIGASPAVPFIPGIETGIHALDVYNDPDKIGKKVIMIGGGLAGCETALHLADTGHDVTLIEMKDELMSDEMGLGRMVTLVQMGQTEGIEIKTGMKCIQIDRSGVKIENILGKKEKVSGDSIVYSLGMKAKRIEAETLRSAAGDADVYEVGDCAKVGKVVDAVSGGFMAAMKIL